MDKTVLRTFWRVTVITQKRIVIATGGCDPLHQGHIHYLEAAKALGDILIVGLNSDGWLCRKKQIPFMVWEEREPIVRALRCVDEVIQFDDRDGSARDAIRIVQERYPNDIIIFANGGDRTAKNIPEMDMPNVEFVFGVGGDNKENSSSDILRRYREYVVNQADRDAGPYLRYT